MLFNSYAFIFGFLPIVLALNVAFVATLPAQDATPNRKGAEGLPRGEKGGGEGGAIADQPLIGLPRVTAAQLEAVELLSSVVTCCSATWKPVVGSTYRPTAGC